MKPNSYCLVFYGTASVHAEKTIELSFLEKDRGYDGHFNKKAGNYFCQD